VCQLGRFCFCSLHAHMRLTEAMVKPLFARAIASNKVPALNAAFKQHLGLDNVFAEVQSDQGSGKVWKPVSFKAFECHLFTPSRMELVLQQVWPDHDAPQAAEAESQAGKRGRKNKSSGKSRRISEWGGIGPDQQKEYKRQYLCLWDLFHTVMDQMRCMDPDRKDLVDFGRNCRNLGARWCMLMPKNRCGALYLHTIMMHGGAFMEHLLPLKLTIGMLENSGAERRHQVGKVYFRKSLGGGGKQYLNMAVHQNRSALLTLRGILIWQYGRDLVALEEMKLSDASTPVKASCRRRDDSGWGTQLARISSHTNAPQSLSRTTGLVAEAEEYPAARAEVAMEAALEESHGSDALAAAEWDRLDEEGAGADADVYQAFIDRNPECATALDEDGGLMIKDGGAVLEYHLQADGHEALSESSDQEGSEHDSPSSACSSPRSDHYSQSEGSESEAMSEDE
jgi:hypothetical protein